MLRVPIFYLENIKRSIWVQNFVSGCCLKFRNDYKHFKQFWIVSCYSVILGSGHKVSATPGRRILGWGMKFFQGSGWGMK